MGQGSMRVWDYLEYPSEWTKKCNKVLTWLKGWVSMQYALSSTPSACSERITPRAVPYPAVARLLKQ